MKDEYDDATPDMFDENAKSKTQTRLDKLQAKLDKGTPITKYEHAELAEREASRPKKVSKPDMTARDAAKAMTTDVISKASGRGGVSSGNAGASDMKFMKGIGNKPDPTYKKGGKVEKEPKSKMKKEMAKDKKQDVAMIKKAFKQHDKQEHKGSKGTTLKLKKGGSIRGCGIASKGLTKGKMI
jgi:hypothetical protein